MDSNESILYILYRGQIVGTWYKRFNINDFSNFISRIVDEIRYPDINSRISKEPHTSIQQVFEEIKVFEEKLNLPSPSSKERSLESLGIRI